MWGQRTAGPGGWSAILSITPLYISAWCQDRCGHSRILKVAEIARKRRGGTDALVVEHPSGRRSGGCRRAHSPSSVATPWISETACRRSPAGKTIRLCEARPDASRLAEDVARKCESANSFTIYLCGQSMEGSSATYDAFPFRALLAPGKHPSALPRHPRNRRPSRLLIAHARGSKAQAANADEG